MNDSSLFNEMREVGLGAGLAAQPAATIAKCARILPQPSIPPHALSDTDIMQAVCKMAAHITARSADDNMRQVSKSYEMLSLKEASTILPHERENFLDPFIHAVDAAIAVPSEKQAAAATPASLVARVAGVLGVTSPTALKLMVAAPVVAGGGAGLGLWMLNNKLHDNPNEDTERMRQQAVEYERVNQRLKSELEARNVIR